MALTPAPPPGDPVLIRRDALSPSTFQVRPRGQRADLYEEPAPTADPRVSTCTSIKDVRIHLGWVPEERGF